MVRLRLRVRLRVRGWTGKKRGENHGHLGSGSTSTSGSEVRESCTAAERGPGSGPTSGSEVRWRVRVQVLLLWARGGRRFDFGFGFGDGRGRRDGRTAATSEVVRLRLRVRRFAKVVLRERGWRVRRDLYTVYGGGQVRVRLRVRRLDGGFRCYLYGQGGRRCDFGFGCGGDVRCGDSTRVAVHQRLFERLSLLGGRGGREEGEEVRLRVRRGMRLRGDVGVGGSGSGSGVTAVEQSLSAHVLDLL